MPYSYTTFIRPTSEDVNVKIYDIMGQLTYTINPYSIVNTQVSNNLIKIYLKELDDVLLDFDNPTESKMALQILQSQVNVLRQKAPLFIDDQTKNYINSVGSIGATGLQGFQGSQGSQGIDGQTIEGPQGFQGPQSPITIQPNNQIVVGDSINGSKSFASNTYDGNTQNITMQFSGTYNKTQTFSGTQSDDLSINIGTYNLNQPITYTTYVIYTYGASPSLVTLKVQSEYQIQSNDIIYGPTTSSYIDGSGTASQYFLYANKAMGQTIQPLNNGLLKSINGILAIRSMTSDVYAKIYDVPNGNLLATCDAPVNAVWTGSEFAPTDATWTFINANFSLVSGTNYYVEFTADTDMFFGMAQNTESSGYPRGSFYHGDPGSVTNESGYSLDFILSYGGRGEISSNVSVINTDIDGYQWVSCASVDFLNNENVLINGNTASVIQNMGSIDMYLIDGTTYQSGTTFSTTDGLQIGLPSTTHAPFVFWTTTFTPDNMDGITVKKSDGSTVFSVGNSTIINSLEYSNPIIQFITTPNYATMISNGIPLVPTIYEVMDDENKSLTRTTYLWKPNGNREFIQTISDN